MVACADRVVGLAARIGNRSKSVKLGSMNMNKKILWVVGVIVIVVAGYYLLCLGNERKSGVANDYKNTEYVIEGKKILLTNGIAEIDIGPGSNSKMVTRYFGNELKTDLNNDGLEDIVFLLTQEVGGSGTFYYAVAALQTEEGYAGSDGYLLGDRIAPQTTELSPNPRHKNVVVVNYADRAEGEPMTAQPSVGKSAYLKLDVGNMQWGIVEPNFEGESR